MEKQVVAYPRLSVKTGLELAGRLNDLFADGWAISISPDVKEFPRFQNGIRLTFVREDEEAQEPLAPVDEEPLAPVDATQGAIDLAGESNLNLGDVKGTGAEGKVTKADVALHLASL